MNFIETEIEGPLIIEPRVFKDERGFFFESFNLERFNLGLKEFGQDPVDFVQDNHSCSSKGVLRGLHFQRDPHAQGKLVRVVHGSAFDVAVDIRPGSPTYGKWVATTLDAKNHKMFWIPPGFAHGFQALEDDTHFLYKTAAYYHPESEVTILWSDPQFAIPWPIEAPILNRKDTLAAGLC